MSRRAATAVTPARRDRHAVAAGLAGLVALILVAVMAATAPDVTVAPRSWRRIAVGETGTIRDLSLTVIDENGHTGTSPPKSRISASDSAMTFFALVLNSPIVRIAARTRSSPSATICAGVSAAAKSPRVALLTPASVACADSTTATRSV